MGVRACMSTHTHAHAHTCTHTHSQNIFLYKNKTKKQNNIYKDQRSSQTTRIEPFTDTNLELNKIKQNLSSVSIHESTYMCTYVHIHTCTEKYILIYTKKFTKTRDLYGQLTSMGHSSSYQNNVHYKKTKNNWKPFKISWRRRKVWNTCWVQVYEIKKKNP